MRTRTGQACYRVSREQEDLLRLLPRELRICRQGLRERGAGNVVEVDGRAFPPPEEREMRQSPEAGSGPGLARAEVSASMGEETATPVVEAGETAPDDTVLDEGEPSEGSNGPAEDNLPEAITEAPEIPVHMEVEHPSVEGNERQLSMQEPDPEASDAPASSAGPSILTGDGNVPNAYAPARSGPSALTRALRRSVNMSDAGRPVRQKPPDDALVAEEVFLTEMKKTRKAEVPEKAIMQREKTELDLAKKGEWKKMTDSGAVRVHIGEMASKLVHEVGRDRLLESRFVITRPDDPVRREKGELKARWCIRGYLDPDLLELQTAAPTLSPEGLATVMQLLASRRWTMHIGDVEAAFLRGEDIKREKGRVLVRVPESGIPGVPKDSIVELLKPVYGLADAPVAWYRSFSKTLKQLDCVQSSLDPCVFYHFHPTTGVVQGALALHVDDMLVGGTVSFMSEVIGKLRKCIPSNISRWGLVNF